MILVNMFAFASILGSPSPPSLLFGTPSAPGGFPAEWVGMDFLRDLYTTAGIEVDFTFGLGELNRSRLFNYTAVVLFESPGQSILRNEPQTPMKVTTQLAKEFPSLLADYVAAGGGVLLFPTDDNWKFQMLRDITDNLFGIRFPLEMINETNERYLLLPVLLLSLSL